MSGDDDAPLGRVIIDRVDRRVVSKANILFSFQDRCEKAMSLPCNGFSRRIQLAFTASRASTKIIAPDNEPMTARSCNMKETRRDTPVTLDRKHCCSPVEDD